MIHTFTTINLPAAPPTALPRVELIMSTLLSRLKYSSVPLQCKMQRMIILYSSPLPTL